MLIKNIINERTHILDPQYSLILPYPQVPEGGTAKKFGCASTEKEKEIKDIITKEIVPLFCINKIHQVSAFFQSCKVLDQLCSSANFS